MVVAVVVVVVYLSIYLSIDRSIDRFICLPASLNMKLFCDTSSIFELGTASLQDCLNFWTWQHQKQSYSARLPQFFTLTTSKRKQFCETSCWRSRTNAFCDFPLHLFKLLRLQRKSDARSYEVLHLSRKIILANLKIWCSKMQPL